MVNSGDVTFRGDKAHYHVLEDKILEDEILGCGIRHGARDRRSARRGASLEFAMFHHAGRAPDIRQLGIKQLSIKHCDRRHPSKACQAQSKISCLSSFSRSRELCETWAFAFASSRGRFEAASTQREFREGLSCERRKP